MPAISPLRMMRSIAARLRRLRGDTGGNVAVYAALTAAVLMGMIGLALDGSRAMITHSEAQSAADAAALAAAAQLDGSATAIARATAAAQGAAPLVSNEQRFAETGTDNNDVVITGIRFLTGLPDDDDIDPIPGSFDTTDPTQARFVEVTTAQLTHNNSFLLTVGAPATGTVQARAVAGFRQIYCKVPPLMICNPDEVNPGDPFNAQARLGAEVISWTNGSGSQWGPGTFGLLQTEACPSSSAACLREVLAALDPNTCVQNQVDVKPGEAVGPVHQGLNVRFDIYAAGSPKNSPPPDSNVTQDFASCTKDDVASGGGAALPPDTNNPAPDRVGNGLWDCASYWAANHSQATPAWCTSSTGYPYTRYYVYQLEREAAYASNHGAPKCHTPGIDDRRVIYMTVVNCKENNVSASSTNVPVEMMLKMFMLRPISQVGSEVEIALEVVEAITPSASSGVLKDDVQLYR